MMMYAPLRQGDLFPTSASSPTSSSEARPARTSAALIQRAKALKASAPASSSKPSASSESAALVGSLLKTALISELGALTPCSLRWRQSATPAGRSWFVLETSEPTTNGRDAGSSGATSSRLPTPVKPNGGRTLSAEAIETGKRANGAKAQIDTPNLLRHATQMLATPRKTDADRGFRGDVLSQLHGHASKHAGMLPTPRKSDASHGPEMTKFRGEKKTGANLRTALHVGMASVGHGPVMNATTKHGETPPTPTKRDKRMDAWSPAYDKRKSPTMDAVMDGALTDRASDKWQYARQIAAILTAHGLSGASMTLPLVYGWMMGFPAGWLERALLSAVQKERLPLPSSSKPTATRSSRRSRRRSDEQSSA